MAVLKRRCDQCRMDYSDSGLPLNRERGMNREQGMNRGAWDSRQCPQCLCLMWLCLNRRDAAGPIAGSGDPGVNPLRHGCGCLWKSVSVAGCVVRKRPRNLVPAIQEFAELLMNSCGNGP